MTKKRPYKQKRTTEIKALAHEYYQAGRGVFINQPSEKLELFKVKSARYPAHPHHGFRVCITRRALKHFVEERRYELEKRHSETGILKRLDLAIDILQEAICNFDRHESIPPKYFYSLDSSLPGALSLRVLVDEKENRIEIRSIHFRTLRKGK